MRKLIDGFIRFHKGVLRMPAYVPPWLALLATVNLIVPLFYIGRIEAQICAVTFLISFMLMIVITALYGFTRLLGAGHFLWLPLIYYLYTRFDAVPPSDFYGIWVRAAIILNSISLLIDVTDVIRYAAGDQSEIVEDL